MTRRPIRFLGFLRFVGFVSAALAVLTTTQAAQLPSVTRGLFGAMGDGTPVEIFTLTNRNGMTVRVITYGAIIQSIRVPDKNGRVSDVVNGHDALDGYRTRSRFFGAVVGRYGNRIAKGKFTLDGHEYTLAVNNGPNHLHGGTVGFDKVVWTPTVASAGAAVSLARTSPDGEEGYPGRLQLTVAYSLSEANELTVRYTARTDKATPINVTQHSYFNLAGHDAGDIGGHILQINADRYTPVDATQIPTGAIAPVAGTPFDFRKPTRIGARIDTENDQLKIGGGYDHNFVLNPGAGRTRLAARVLEPTSGRTLEVTTTEPGIQFYSGNKLDGSIMGKAGTVYGRRSGFCLETQHFPDSPNHPEFPSTILRPGRLFESMTAFKFGVER